MNNQQINNKKKLPAVTWTPEQLAAITTSGCNLLVAAAAGSGKTAVLVERIIKKITDDKNPVDIDRMLIVTFTNAAATEMRERIGAAIIKALEKKPESRQLQKQLTLLHKASITTIHSFCLEVIRNNFHCIDLDPNFRIAHETETVLLKIEALEELFEERYQTDPIQPEFIRLVECYGGSIDDSMLQDMVFALYDFVQSAPWPKMWLHQQAEAFNLPEHIDFAETAWGKVLMRSLRIELQGFLNILKTAENIILQSEGLQPYHTNIVDDIHNINLLISKCAGTWDELYDAFTGTEFSRLARCGKEADKEKQEQVKNIRDEVKKRLKKVKEEVFCAISREITGDLRNLYPLMQCLCDLVMEFDDRYAYKKKEKALVDFNDLEHFCLEILTGQDADGNMIPTKTAEDLQQRFEEILIDEYQDSNMVQEVIMNVISRKNIDKPNIFMVGDVKQSIYRFRQARPELFLDKYMRYSGDEGMPERRIRLYKNFRSRKEVIDGVNFIFQQMMSKDVGELEYDEVEALNFGAHFDSEESSDVSVGGPVELHLIDLKHDEDDRTFTQPNDDVEDEEMNEQEEEQPDQIQCEARIVAKRIKQLMSADETGTVHKIYDKNAGGYRTVAFKDIIILLRTTRNWADIFVEELGMQGIPAYADTGTGYFKTVEIKTMMSLLQIIDNPMQDIPLLSVLRSPIASFTPEELIDIRLVDKECSFYECMKKLSIEDSNQTAHKTQKFLDRLAHWRKNAGHMSTDELIWYLYTDTGYFSFVGVMPGGEQRQANLKILFERARQFEETSYKGLFNFINFINKLKSSRGDMGSAKILGENENVVRIMSIHKSKGLEFPVVFVCGTGKQFNMQDMNKSILLHQDLGFGPEFVDHERRIAYPSVPKQALKYKIKLESLSEEMRILYVAFTRAKEKLIITGCIKGLEKTAAAWCKSLETIGAKLPEYEKMKAKSYLDWIGPIVVKHKDGKLLRNTAGVDQEHALIDHDSTWDIKLWTKKDAMGIQQEMEQKEQELLQHLEQDAEAEHGYYQDEIDKRLSWQYSYKVSEMLPTKMSVTELKRHFNAELADEYAMPIFIPTLIKKPLFMEESKGLNAAERGSAMHFVMQHLKLDKIASVQELSQQLKEMVGMELLTEQQAGVVDVRKIRRFFDSPLGQRLLNADEVNREIPFNIELKSTELHKELDEEIYGEESILLQGMIDCYFEEQDELVLVDYKTDYVPDGDMDIIKERYRVQIEYYAKALESITCKRVKERYIYLFWNGETLSMQ
ncbi:helicase-exonuclease AddAB subunit AddA [Petroclostridium sp. X23]|uniref:helicase-exonuclease AddAB subunit AddA n=1 Tax=Petroclostridium sp. X23 TaxID=3045146 RepID=UPI0024AE560D|nr:helicase-exonuclease AddAB subunit AddA [Petroclostridium sp. X23]WHH57448.1 helicase-exonuclease AddAB subunit AddA [Petroclostridium sp. X23]